MGQLASSTNGEKSPKLINAESLFMEGMKNYIAEDYKTAISIFNQVIEKFEPEAGIYSMLSTAYQKNGNINDAVKNAELATKKDKANSFYIKQYAALLLEQKNYKQAQDNYEILLKIKPQDPEAYFALADIYLLENKFNDAIRVFDKLEKTIGVNEEITRQKQLIYLKQNKIDEVIKEGDRLIESEPLDSDHIIQQAQILLENNKTDKAKQLLEEFLTENTGFSEGHVLLAEIYRKNSEPEKCLKELQSAFKNQSLSVDSKIRILQSYLSFVNEKTNEKTIQQVIDLTKDVIRLDPEEARGYVFMGDLYMKSGLTKEARDAYVKSTEYDKSVFEVWLAIVELDGKLDDNEALIKDSGKAAEYFPNQTYFWYQNGLGLILKKEYDEAAISLEEAKSLAFDNDELLQNILELLGLCYYEQKEYADSDKSFEQALKINPDNLKVLNNYSYFLALRKSKLERAKDLSSRLYKIDPENVKYADTRAWVLFQSGEYPLALSTLEPIIKNAKIESAVIYEHYGDILFKNDKKEQAIEQWKKARNLGSESKILDQKIAKEQFLE